jgi:hypothetical protein
MQAIIRARFGWCVAWHWINLISPRIRNSYPNPIQFNLPKTYVQAFGHLDDIVSAFEDLKRLLRQEPNNKAARQLVQRLKERATEKSSVRFQVMEKLKASGQDPAERLKNLRQVLGSLNEDPELGKEVLRGEGLQVLWDTATDPDNGEPFAIIVLARLAEDKAEAGVATAIAKIVDPAVVLGWAKDPEVSGAPPQMGNLLLKSLATHGCYLVLLGKLVCAL